MVGAEAVAGLRPIERRGDLSATVAIIDAPGGGYVEQPDIEQAILGDRARVELVLVTLQDRGSLAFLQSPFLILWHRVALDAAFFEENSACRGVVCASVGYDHVDVEAARRCGVALYHVPYYGTEEVADHTVALFLALARRIVPLHQHVLDGGWDWRAAHGVRRLRSQTWGIVGLGRIGTAVAVRAKLFGMRVQFYDPYSHPGLEKSLDLHRAYTLDELLATSDVVSIHVPLDQGTHHLIGAEQLRLIRPESVLINTARGGVIETSALRDALRDGRPGYVGLDVVDGEPEIPGWLRSHPRVLLTPHSAFYSVDSLAELRSRAARAVGQLIDAVPVTNAERII